MNRRGGRIVVHEPFAQCLGEPASRFFLIRR
jgi:hypothetical protein